MLIDVHAHFYHDHTPRADWRERNASRLRAGDKIGVTIHVASVLGSWGRTSPTYFPSPADVLSATSAARRHRRDRKRCTPPTPSSDQSASWSGGPMKSE